MKIKKLAKFCIVIFIVAVWLVGPITPALRNNFLRPDLNTSHSAPLINTRSRTVEFFVGQYSGNGTAGQNSDTNHTFATSSFLLAEKSVSIKSAFVVFEGVFEAYNDNTGNYTGFDLAFDSCASSCTAAAFTGSGRIFISDATALAYDESESNTFRFVANVTSETQLAGYTGSSTVMDFQFGYNIKRGAAVSSISETKAKLVITYTYDANSDAYTNTVKYPLESTTSGDQGSRKASQASGCTRNSNCPLFSYNMSYAESTTTRHSTWFETHYFNDGNNTSDITQNVNIQGTDVNSSNVIHESANGGSQGNGFAAFFNGVSGYQTATSQTLEIYHSAGTLYLMGGDITETYTAPASNTTKTKTVSYSIGEISPGGNQNLYSASVNVYLPESSATIKKAWVKFLGSTDSNSNMTLSINTKVGNNSITATTSYAFNSPGTVPEGTFMFNHVIPSGDYSELQGASASASKTITTWVQGNSNNIRGVSAELFITYTHTSETSSYQVTNSVFAGLQTSAPSLSYTGASGGVDPTLPETSGNKTVRSAHLLVSMLQSDSDGSAPAGPSYVGAALSTGSCSASNSHYVSIDSLNTYDFWYKNVTSVVTNSDTQTYQSCTSHNGGGDSGSVGAKISIILTYTYQVDLPKFEQSGYRWFANATGTSVGNPLALENVIGVTSTNTPIRLRLLIHVSNGQLGVGNEIFKLQFASKSGDCDPSFSGETYSDIATSSGNIKSYDNASVSDGQLLSATSTDPGHSGHTIVNQTVEEANTFTSTSTIPSGQDGKWDFPLIVDSAVAKDSRFCLRVVKNDGSLLETYTTSTIPELSIGGTPPTVSNVVINGNSNMALMESSTTTINVTATVADQNGYPDIQSVTGKLYRSGVGQSCSGDPNNCYQSGSCSLSGCSGDSCTATCSFSIWYFADPTDSTSSTPWSSENWQAWVEARDLVDTAGSATSSNPVDMLSLLAISVTPSINYGSLAPGDIIDPLSVSMYATSTGNVSLDSAIYGTNMVAGPNNISASRQHYSTSTQSYASGTTLLVSPGQEWELNLKKVTSSTTTQSTAQFYWGIQIPNPQATGDYSGNNTFTGIVNELPWP